jgi:hypothetical protein
MRSTTLRVLVAVVAAVAFAAGVLTSQFSFVVLGMVAVLLLASSFSQAGRLTGPLQRFCHQAVAVRVWGASLPVPNGAAMTIASVRSLGAGLHIYLQLGTNGSLTHLKVAQPQRVLLEPGALIIESASYVQWSGKRLPRAIGSPALSITLEEHLAINRRDPPGHWQPSTGPRR